MQKIIKIPIYHTKVVIKIVDDVRLESIKIYRKNKQDVKDEKEYRGLVFNFDIDCFYVLFDKVCITHGLLAHELSHFCDDVLEVNNVIDKEAKAFICEFVTTEIYKFLDLKNIEVK